MNYVIKRIFNYGFFKIFKEIPWYGIFLFLILVFVGKNFAYQYEFKGVYTPEEIFLNYCDKCYLNLPPEYLKSEIVLSINTDNERELIRAIQQASMANNWDFKKNGKTFTAEPLQNQGKLIYISCLTNEPINVEKYLYHYSRKSDSIKCAERDRKLFVIDSLNHLPQPLPTYKTYELQYYSYTQEFTRKLGLDWQEVLAAGTLHDVPNINDDWQFKAQTIGDTSYTFRQLVFSVDTLSLIDWGTEEQTLERIYNDGGIITENYEWRKFGIIIAVKRANQQVKLSYTFRDKQQSISVLQGEIVGNENDTLILTGNYTTNREISQGIPFLNNIPLIGCLFSYKNISQDWRKFDIVLIPKKQERKEDAAGN